MVSSSRFTRSPSEFDPPPGDGAAQGPAQPDKTAAGLDFASLWAEVQQRVPEMQEYAATYLSARADLVGAKIRRLVVRMIVLGFIAAIALVLLLTAAVLTVWGAASGLGVLLGDRPWAGQLIVGGGMIAAVLVGLMLVARGMSRTAKERTQVKYGKRHHEQRDRFGHDVHAAANQR